MELYLHHFHALGFRHRGNFTFKWYINLLSHTVHRPSSGFIILTDATMLTNTYSVVYGMVQGFHRTI
jgi:hypothetical protein